MKKTFSLTSLSTLLALALSSQAMAATTNLDVTFTASLRETTCDVKIEGGAGDGKNNTIPIGTSGKTSLADITAGSDVASTTFKLKIVECPSSLQSLKTTITGIKSVYSDTIINNSATGTKADYTGVSIARSAAPAAPFTINATDDAKRLVWTAAEISSKEVSLIARMAETKAGLATTGDFSAVATFNFEYQ
ncbi:fimbrial protein [Enterobacter hormaechei]